MKGNEKMKIKNTSKTLSAVFGGVIVLVSLGCSTTSTTTYFKDDGKTVDRVVVESSVSDANALADYLRQADNGCATDRSLDISKFTLGYGDVGLAWLSIGGNSTKAPATETDSDKVLVGMSEVKKAGKTTVQTPSLGVNAEAAGK